MSDRHSDDGRRATNAAANDQIEAIGGIQWWHRFAPVIGAKLSEISAWLADQSVEHVQVLFLCGQYDLVASECFGQGSQTAVSIDVRAILRRAITLDARKIIIMHNHPVGGPEPSRSDIVQTDRLANAARQVGIAVVDHIIVSGHATTSLMQARYASTAPPRSIQASIADYARITVRIEQRKNFLESSQRAALSGTGWILASILYFEERPTAINELARLAGMPPTVAIRWLTALADLELVKINPTADRSSMTFAELSELGAELLDQLMSTAFWSGPDRVMLRSSRHGLLA